MIYSGQLLFKYEFVRLNIMPLVSQANFRLTIRSLGKLYLKFSCLEENTLPLHYKKLSVDAI